MSADNVTSILDRPKNWGTTGLAADKTKGRSERGVEKKGRGSRTAESHVANALRSAYEEAVKEDVPNEFLDLLGKLS